MRGMLGTMVWDDTGDNAGMTLHQAIANKLFVAYKILTWI